ncbi:MAG: zinc-dependent metalloprotease [Halobacteriaceae archaeon]
MSFYRSFEAVVSASGPGIIDWNAVESAAKERIEPGSIALTDEEKQAYADDVKDAKANISRFSSIEFEVPDQIEIQNRYHWIETNIEMFKRILAAFEEQPGKLPGLTRVINTGSMAAALSFLANHVLGQYDPLLLAESDVHELYIVHPNVVKTSAELDIEFERFRRWIVLHEVTHAAEFGAAPWLSDYLENKLAENIEAIKQREFSRESFQEINLAMTTIEGFAELLMDEAFDREYIDLRKKVEAKRKGGDPVTRLFKRILGLGLKRQQYERGAEFFRTIVSDYDVDTATRVWDTPENFPTENELENPHRWVTRIR